MKKEFNFKIVLLLIPVLILISCNQSPNSNDETNIKLFLESWVISTYTTVTTTGYSGGNAMLDPVPLDESITALSTTHYSCNGIKAALAGAWLQVVGPKGTDTVWVTDLYPDSDEHTQLPRHGALDLCPSAFVTVTGSTTGIFREGIKWRVIKSPKTGNLTYRFKDGSSAHWAQIQIRNHNYPVFKMEYYNNNNWINMPKEQYNYFHGGSMGSQYLKIRITDIRDSIVTDTIQINLPLNGVIPTTDIVSNLQFPD